MRSLQIWYIFVLRAKKITTFRPKVVKTSAMFKIILNVLSNKTINTDLPPPQALIYGRVHISGI